jgi:glyoxylase-like metal-dependent hydrolase (beta-lactamase superfamily II)
MNGNKLLDTSLTTGQFSAQDNGIVPTMVRAAAGAKIRTQPVRRNISILEGSGGNIAVLTGPDGKLLVDTGFAVSRDAITNALTSINSDPIKHLINTHWHTDHTDGNAWLHQAGAAILAHENTRRHLSVRLVSRAGTILSRQHPPPPFQQKYLRRTIDSI